MCYYLDIEDEFHFILKCPLYKDLRCIYIKKNTGSSHLFLNLFDYCQYEIEKNYVTLVNLQYMFSHYAYMFAIVCL